MAYMVDLPGSRHAICPVFPAGWIWSTKLCQWAVSKGLVIKYPMERGEGLQWRQRGNGGSRMCLAPLTYRHAKVMLETVHEL